MTLENTISQLAKEAVKALYGIEAEDTVPVRDRTESV